MPTQTRRNFWALWTATTFANLADGVFKLALPLLAVQLTLSPGLVAGTIFALTLPWPLFALPVGALGDRLDRRYILVCSNLLRISVLGLLTTTVLLDVVTLPLLYGVAFLLGTAEVFYDTISPALVPTVVPKQKLEQGNAWLTGSQTVTNEFVGPPLGGALAAVGIGLALGTSAGLYIFAVFALVLMTGAFRPAYRRTTGIRSDIVEGIKFLWQQPVLRTLTIILSVTAGCWNAWFAVLVLYVVAPGPVGLSPFGYGILMTCLGIGGVLGAALTPLAITMIGRRGVIATNFLTMITMLSVPVITTNVWIIGISMVAGGVGSSLWNITVGSLRQRITPEHLQGRVVGVGRLIGWGSVPLSAGISGIVAETFGVRAVFAGGAILTAAMIVPFVTVITNEAITRAIADPHSDVQSSAPEVVN